MAITPQDKSTPAELRAMIHPRNIERIAEYAQYIDSDHDYTVNAIFNDWFAANKPTKKASAPPDQKPTKHRTRSAAAGGN